MVRYELLVAAGHTDFSYQENRRTSFSLDGAWLELDSWPGIPPYLEIEGATAEQVHMVAARIGFSPSQLTRGWRPCTSTPPTAWTSRPCRA